MITMIRLRTKDCNDVTSSATISLVVVIQAIPDNPGNHGSVFLLLPSALSLPPLYLCAFATFSLILLLTITVQIQPYRISQETGNSLSDRNSGRAHRLRVHTIL